MRQRNNIRIGVYVQTASFQHNGQLENEKLNRSEMTESEKDALTAKVYRARRCSTLW